MWSSEPSPSSSTSNTYDDPVCTACKVGILQPHEGFLTCPTCGTQGEACIESGAEWRSFGAEDAKVSDPARCGSSTATYLSKDDASKNADASGSQISCRWRESRKMRTARMMQGWSLANPNTRAFRKDIREKKCLLYTKGYTSLIVDDAVHRFVEIKKLEAKKNIKCRSENNQGLWAYCVKETCKKHGVPRSVKEICADLGLTNQVMTRGHAVYVKARKEADVHDHKVNESTTIKKDVDQPHDFVPRFCSKLGLSDSVRRDVHNVTVVTKRCGLVPDKPALIAVHLVGHSKGRRRHIARDHQQVLQGALERVCAVFGAAHWLSDRSRAVLTAARDGQDTCGRACGSCRHFWWTVETTRICLQTRAGTHVVLICQRLLR